MTRHTSENLYALALFLLCLAFLAADCLTLPTPGAP